MKTSFAIALAALDKNRIDGKAAAAIQLCDAADDLLSALQQLLALSESFDDQGRSIDAVARVAARAAIAKATAK